MCTGANRISSSGNLNEDGVVDKHFIRSTGNRATIIVGSNNRVNVRVIAEFNIGDYQSIVGGFIVGNQVVGFIPSVGKIA